MTKKRLRILFSVIIVSVLMVPVAVQATVITWANTRGYAHAPKEGEFIWNNNPGNILWGPNILKWDASGVAALQSLWMNPLIELEGADPTDPSTCNQLESSYAYANFPNTGWTHANTCGDSTRKEQFDIVIKRNGGVIANHAYTAWGVYNKVSGASGVGEVNFSYELVLADSWMGKEEFSGWNPTCANPAGAQPGVGGCP